MNTTKPKQEISGKDEMNLAEYPFARLNARDQRDVIEYEGWVVEAGQRLNQKWLVRGASGLGLPSEFGERILIALMTLTAEANFSSPKVEFSIGELIRRLGLGKGTRQYKLIEQQLDRLVGVTIHSENAFWDHEVQERVTTQTAFHLLERVWLRRREGNKKIRQVESANGYIIWSDTLWKSFQAGYIKQLDIGFYSSLPTPLSRRLYRFLDKRMRYQCEYEIDIFDLANRLGCVRYEAPSQVKRILMPACEILIEYGFLVQAKTVKHGKYTRLYFAKAGASAQHEPDPEPSPETVVDAVELTITDLAQQWQQTLDSLRLQMTKSTFETWLQPTILLSQDEQGLTIGAKDEHAQSWLNHRLRPTIERVVQAQWGDEVGVRFVVMNPISNEDG